MLVSPEDEVEHGVDKVLGDVARRAVLHAVLGCDSISRHLRHIPKPVPNHDMYFETHVLAVLFFTKLVSISIIMLVSKNYNFYFIF